MQFQYITARHNFLLRQLPNGEFALTGDLVARVMHNGQVYRLVIPADTATLRKPKPGKARARLLKHLIYSLPESLKTRDDAYLAAIKDDHGKTNWLRRGLRIRGYLTKLWKYNG